VIRNIKIGVITMPKGKEKKPKFVNIAPLKDTRVLEYCPKCNSKNIHMFVYFSEETAHSGG
jgi:hypothetical protein